MRELTVDLFCTVDGWASGTNAPAYFGHDGPGLQEWVERELARPQVMVLGRVTYEALSGMPENGRMDAVPKLVVSRTLTGSLPWNATAVADPSTLKDGDGDPLRVIGSLSLVKSLLHAGLVDRLRLLVFPQILGATGDQPIFTALPDLDLTLRHTEVLDGRLVLLDYAFD